MPLLREFTGLINGKIGCLWSSFQCIVHYAFLSWNKPLMVEQDELQYVLIKDKKRHTWCLNLITPMSNCISWYSSWGWGKGLTPHWRHWYTAYEPL
jgi:hypothetical protein